MKTDKLASALKAASGISLIEIIEMPLINQPHGEKLRHAFLVNVGPTVFPSSEPTDILRECWTIAERIVVLLSNRADCSRCRFGLSIFTESGDQSGRVFTGTVEIGEMNKGTGNIPEVRDPRSNNREIDALLQQKRSL